ncbi:hypothetical protein D3C80_1760190 [compost metagenome]
MHGTFYLNAAGIATALALREISTVYLCYITVFVFFETGTFYDIGMLQAGFQSYAQAEIFGRRVFHKVITLDP